MLPFRKITAKVAQLLLDNIDTDMIIPKQFLKTITRKGLGQRLFYEMRFDSNGTENPDFILNKNGFRDAQILLAGDNFGCGSSREHAPWALLDFGIRVVISTSFADIFYNNCFENGILPIFLPKNELEKLKNMRELSIDLEEKIILGDGVKIPFEIDDFKRHKLLNGLDSIGLTLEKADKIADFERTQAENQPWLWP